MKYYAGKPKKNNEFRIYIYHNHDGKMIRIATKLTATEKLFDPIKNIALTESLQAVLDGWLAKIRNSIVEQERRGNLIDYNRVKQIIQKVTTNKTLNEDLTIRSLYHEYMKNFELADSTRKNYKMAIRLFEEFLRITKSTDIIERYTVKEFQKFVKYLKELKYADNTIKIYTKCIKKVVNKAYWDGRIENEVGRMMKFKAKNIVKTDYVIFSSEELRQLEGLTLRPEARQRMDIFLWLCYTGVRFSDYKRFVFEPERCEFSAEQLVIAESVKTGKRIFVPNAGYCSGAWRILKKYNGHLPKYQSRDSFNRALKKDFMRLKHHEYQKITSHCARKTFTTILLLEDGMPPLVVSKLLTHSDIRVTMRHYEKGGDEHLRNALKKTEKPQSKPNHLKIV